MDLLYGDISTVLEGNVNMYHVMYLYKQFSFFMYRINTLTKISKIFLDLFHARDLNLFLS